MNRSLLGKGSVFKHSKMMDEQKHQTLTEELIATITSPAPSRKKKNRFGMGSSTMPTQLRSYRRDKKLRDPNPQSQSPPRRMTMRDSLAQAIKLMVHDQKMTQGVQRVNDVRKAVERRLKRSKREEERTKISSLEDLYKQADIRKPNVLINKAQSRVSKLNVETGIPYRVLIKESLQERVLEKHKTYMNGWHSQTQSRMQRYKDDFEPENIFHTSDSYSKAKKIKVSTGDYCGQRQQVSILNASERYY